MCPPVATFGSEKNMTNEKQKILKKTRFGHVSHRAMTAVKLVLRLAAIRDLPRAGGWVFRNDNDSASNCATNCANNCANNVRLWPTFRRALFASPIPDTKTDTVLPNSAGLCNTMDRRSSRGPKSQNQFGINIPDTQPEGSSHTGTGMVPVRTAVLLTIGILSIISQKG